MGNHITYSLYYHNVLYVILDVDIFFIYLQNELWGMKDQNDDYAGMSELLSDGTTVTVANDAWK